MSFIIASLQYFLMLMLDYILIGNIIVDRIGGDAIWHTVIRKN